MNFGAALLIRGGVPQSVAMRVTGRRSGLHVPAVRRGEQEDKLEALRRAREYAETRKAIGENVTAFPTERADERAHAIENAGVSEGIWLGGRDSNPEGPANGCLTSPTDAAAGTRKSQ